MFGLPLMYAALLVHPQRDLSALRLCLYAMARAHRESAAQWPS